MSSYVQIQKIAREEINFSDLASYDYQDHSFRVATLYLSLLVYFRWDFVEKSLPKLKGYVSHSIFDVGSTEAFLVEFENDVVVSFRGTQKKPSDFATIVQFWQSDFESTKTHNGFKDSLKRVQDKIIDKVTKAKSKGKSIHYTGHSMGAALATMMCLLYKPDTCVVYASPKALTGDRYKSFFEKINFVRFNNDYDYIPKLPWRIPFVSDFRHVGYEIKFKRRFSFSSHSLLAYVQSVVAGYKLSQNNQSTQSTVDLEKFIELNLAQKK